MVEFIIFLSIRCAHFGLVFHEFVVQKAEYIRLGRMLDKFTFL